MDDYSTPKKMKKVGDLFEKYRRHFKAPQASVEKACVDSIFKITGFEVKRENIRYTVSTRTISLNIPSVLKNEIKFKHKEILENLELSLGKDVSPKIIL